MPAKRTVALALAALLAFSAVAAAGAHGDHAADQAQHSDDADERSDDAGPPDEAGPPDQALFGLCTAWSNNEDGRDNGSAGLASPFAALGNALCDDVSHPSEDHAQQDEGDASEASDKGRSLAPFAP